MSRHALFLALLCALLSGGCALNEIARKEDIAVAKTDLADEILNIRNENRVLSEKLQATTHRLEELTAQLETAKAETSNSAKFIKQRLRQLGSSIMEARKHQEKISSDLSAKIHVVLDEVSKENTRLHEQIDKLAQPKKRGRTEGSPGTYTVVVGDSLAKIAKRYGVSVSTLLDLNKLEDPNHLKTGQRLTLPAEAKTN